MKTKRKAITGRRRQELPRNMGDTVESGRLVAVYTRKENGQVDYDITVFRQAGTSPQSIHWMDAADIEHMVQLLAFEMSEDRILDQELCDDFGCLAASLEPVFCSGKGLDALYCHRDGNAWQLLTQLLMDELQLSEISFRDAPHCHHPCRRLVALDLWITGIGPRDGF